MVVLWHSIRNDSGVKCVLDHSMCSQKVHIINEDIDTLNLVRHRSFRCHVARELDNGHKRDDLLHVKGVEHRNWRLRQLEHWHDRMRGIVRVCKVWRWRRSVQWRLLSRLALTLYETLTFVIVAMLADILEVHTNRILHVARHLKMVVERCRDLLNLFGCRDPATVVALGGLCAV